MILALLGIWNASALGINNHAIFTYNYRLRSLTKYIAQLSMESNGKSINFDSTMANQQCILQYISDGMENGDDTNVKINKLFDPPPSTFSAKPPTRVAPKVFAIVFKLSMAELVSSIST